MNAQPRPAGGPQYQSFTEWLNDAFSRQSPPLTWEEVAARADWPLEAILKVRDGEDPFPLLGVMVRLQQALGEDYDGPLFPYDPDFDDVKKNLTMDEILKRWFQNIPPEEFEKLPTDGAAQHDHYIYGTPKRKDV